MTPQTQLIWLKFSLTQTYIVAENSFLDKTEGANPETI